MCSSDLENAIFNALALKSNVSDGNIFTVTDVVVTIASTQTFTIPTGHKAITVLVNGQPHYKTTGNNLSLVNRWSQTGDVVTLTKSTAVNNYIYIISK